MSSTQSTPNVSERGPLVRWRTIHKVVAALIFLVVATGLFLGYEVLGAFRTSVAVNQQWAAKLNALSELAQAASLVNAPGKDVFATRNVNTESKRQAEAATEFASRLADLRNATAFDDAQIRAAMQQGLDAVSVAMDEMLAESQGVFANFRAKNAAEAGRRMAAMDRKFAKLNEAILDMSRTLREVQSKYFQDQVNGAAKLRTFDYVFAIALIAMVACGAWMYGNHVIRMFRTRERERAEEMTSIERSMAHLRETANEASAASKTKSDFLAMMSHEIRTPMNGILGMAGALLDAKLTPDQHRSAMTIRESAETLLRILNDILDFSKLEAGALPIEKFAFDLHELLRYAVEIVTPRTRAKPVALELLIEPGVPECIRSDPGRIRQVVLTFLGNAAKYTERGSITLHASVSDCGNLRIEVRDTGIGISPGDLPMLFRSFQQADPSAARKFGGTGLGLAISKRLVELLDGQVGVESARNIGSTFWFEIPLQAASRGEISASDGPGERAVEAAMSNIAALGRPLRILIAEDTPTNLLVAKTVLAKFGITPDTVQNGIEAVEAVRKIPYDVVLMDLHMPEMDGLDASRTIRSLISDAARVPIIALTANAFADDIAKCKAAGMNGHLSKPFRRAELICAIGDAVGFARKLALAGTQDTVSEPAAGPSEEDCVDWNALDAFRATAGEDTLQLLVSTYLSSTVKLLSQFSEIVRNDGDPKEALRIAHSIKSSSSQAGAMLLSKVAAALEARAVEGDKLSPSDEAEMTRLFDAYRRALANKGMIAA